ncbi:MAG: c-type cytochrome [Pseudomonadota bacterium]
MKPVRTVLCYVVLVLSSTVLLACGSKVGSTKSANSQVSAVENTFNQSCVSCHLSGMAGAPRKGDTAEWARRLQAKGMPALIDSVKQGMGAMPPMGMCSECDDETIEQLIVYMSK